MQKVKCIIPDYQIFIEPLHSSNESSPTIRLASLISLMNLLHAMSTQVCHSIAIQDTIDIMLDHVLKIQYFFNAEAFKISVIIKHL